MIYTVTLNPSIDHVIEMNELQEGIVNKVNIENFYAGGKGINVSKILKEHGVENIALGFISGFTGEFIKNNLEQCGIKNDFINVLNGYSRINMKIKTNENETEINGLGPSISSSNIKDLFNQLEKLSSNDILVLAGSIPPSLSDNFYEEIMKQLSTKNVKIIVDARNNLLLNVLKYRPFLIKPNHHEISEIFNKEIKTIDELIFHGNKLKEMGAQNVLVSMGKIGAVLIDNNNNEYFVKSPEGKRINTVGSGDSMVAGFLAGYIKFNNYEKALKMGVSAGTASALSEYLATKEEIYNLYNNL